MRFNNIIIRYSEIWLKAKATKTRFESILINNIKDCLGKNKIKYDKIIKSRGRILIFNIDETACEYLRCVIGLASLSPCIQVNEDDLNETCLLLYKKGTFRISTQRVWKNFKKTSREIDKEIGAYIVKKTNAKVNLNKPDTNIGIEILKEGIFVFNKKINCFGGLPVSSQGKALCIINKSIESLVSCFLIMKRGCIPYIYIKSGSANILKKFEYGFRIKEENKIFGDIKTIVTSDKITKKKGYLIINPVIGFDKKSINSIYAKIK